jgi:ribA/ribD-fused uncharacterized protein
MNDVVIKNGFVFFWGGFPSNWEPAKFSVSGIEYNCAEQYMMSQKARMFGDTEVLEKIMASPYPKAQKEFGGKVRGYVESIWAAVRVTIVFDAVYAKFAQNPHLLALLHEHEGLYVEASPYDTIWGIGMGMNEKGVDDPEKWRGQNLLGQVVTMVRKSLIHKR